MTDENLAVKYDRAECLADLTEAGYIAGPRYGRKKEAEFTVFVTPDDKAGGELTAILRRHNYMPLYPKTSGHDDFAFEVKVEPASWHEAEYNFTRPDERGDDE